MNGSQWSRRVLLALSGAVLGLGFGGCLESTLQRIVVGLVI